jgi:hypothetical protein
LRSFIVLRATLCQLAIVASALAFARVSVGAERGEAAVDEPATSQGDPSYANDLVARARAAHLESDVQWLRLGHWHRGASNDVRGEADGPLFWLDPRGNADPAAELEATIRGIWAPEPEDPHVQHPFCRFPARMMWLDERLHLDAARLPRRVCARYGEFLKKLRPGSIALVFSSYYLNNPASAFGHTFLRIHKAGAARSSELLDTGIDFSAQVDTTNALLYAIKGLAGLFPGMFHSLPFYYKVREYNDYESRDLWEYELDLSPRAVAMVVAHLWEEGSTYFDYFYLSENCSYHVLAALEVGDPSLHLLSHLRNPVVPVDTVRALFAEKGLVREVRFRPSLRSTVRHELAILTRDQTQALGALIVDPEAPLPEAMPAQARAEVLDVASDLVDVREAEAVLKGDDPRVLHLKQRLLERRAEIPVATDATPVPVPIDKMPQVGHATSRIGLGTGYSPQLGGDFYELRYRLALHDLTDPPDGYPETSELEFLPARLRFYPKESSFEFEELSILRIMSLSPWGRFQHPLSWALNTGVARVRDSGCPDCLASLVDLAAGFTFGVGNEDAVVLYALADAGIKYASRMHGLGDSDWRPGVGPVGGLRWRLARTLVWTADATWSWLPLAKPNGTWLAETNARWALAPDVALAFELRVQPLATDGVLSAMLYY